MKIAVWGLLLWAGANGLPQFDAFKVIEQFTGKAAPPVLRTRLQQTFRTVIRDAVRSGPNFAGSFTLAEWGCGAGCVSVAVVDSKTGTTYDGPFQLLGYDLAYNYEGGDEQVEFKKDSRLMIARGCPGEKDCGTYYYEWTGNGFKLLRKSPAQQKPRGNP